MVDEVEVVITNLVPVDIRMLMLMLILLFVCILSVSILVSVNQVNSSYVARRVNTKRSDLFYDCMIVFMML